MNNQYGPHGSARNVAVGVVSLLLAVCAFVYVRSNPQHGPSATPIPEAAPHNAPEPLVPVQSPGQPLVSPATPSPPLVGSQLLDWTDTFASGSLEAKRWVVTSANDFKEKNIDVVPTASGTEKYRLKFRADTRQTKDETVKFLGVRSVEPISLNPGSRISADLDWNNQTNGCYLSLGLVLCPSKVDDNPLTASDWLKIEYIGVPPGLNGRIVLVAKMAGREKYLFTEGWPEKNKGGRKIGLQHIELQVEQDRVKLLENGSVIFESTEKPFSFTTAHVYLQMSSHSNYPARELFVNKIDVHSVQTNK